MRLIALRNDNAILVQLPSHYSLYMQSADILHTHTYTPELDGNVNSQQIYISKSKFANMWTRLDVSGIYSSS